MKICENKMTSLYMQVYGAAKCGQGSWESQFRELKYSISVRRNAWWARDFYLGARASEISSGGPLPAAFYFDPPKILTALLSDICIVRDEIRVCSVPGVTANRWVNRLVGPKDD